MVCRVPAGLGCGALFSAADNAPCTAIARAGRCHRVLAVVTAPRGRQKTLAVAKYRAVLFVSEGAATQDGFVGSLALNRQVGQCDRFLGGLSGADVGILGLGQIGKAFGRRAEAFGMDVRFWNRSPVKDTTWKSCASPVALAEDSDVLCVIVAANAQTKDVVNAEVLKALGPKGILINIARGSVVDENALLAALNDGTIGAAGLDVYLDEPRIREDFFTAPNTVLMPHQGSATVETRVAMGELVLANIAAHFAGEKPPTTVN